MFDCFPPKDLNTGRYTAFLLYCTLDNGIAMDNGSISCSTTIRYMHEYWEVQGNSRKGSQLFATLTLLSIYSLCKQTAETTSPEPSP